MTTTVDTLCLISLAKLRNDDIMYMPIYVVELGDGEIPNSNG
jgi:hypothetical protein